MADEIDEVTVTTIENTPVTEDTITESPVTEGSEVEMPETESSIKKRGRPAKQTEAVKEVESELVTTVLVTVPRAFNLRLNASTLLEVKAGVQEMEQEYAEHWYSKANGVVIYKSG